MGKKKPNLKKNVERMQKQRNLQRSEETTECQEE